MRLEGRTYFVTGAAGGIGQAATNRIIQEGGQVAAMDLSAEKLGEMAARYKDAFLCLPGDASEAEHIGQAIEQAVQRFGALDGAFLNAAVDGPMAPLLDIEIADFDKVFSLNVRGQFLALQMIGKAMRDRGGSVVLTSSINGLRAIGNSSPYTISKMAVLGLARAAAKDLSVYGIRVNTIHPGFIETPMLSRAISGLAPGAEQEMRDALVSQVPLSRVGQPTDIGAALAFLLSDDSAYITGSQLVVDGGVIHAL